MIQAQHHIIQNVRIDVSDPGGSYALTEKLKSWFYGNAQPAIDELLSELVPANLHLRLETLEIDLGVHRNLDVLLNVGFDDKARLTDLLIQRLREALEPYVPTSKKSQSETETPFLTEAQKEQVSMLPVESHAFADWLYFLESGLRPWWGGTEMTFFQNDPCYFVSQKNKRQQLLRLVKRSSAAKQRLLGDPRHQEMLETLVKDDAALAKSWEAWQVLAAEPQWRSYLKTTGLSPETWQHLGQWGAWQYLLEASSATITPEALLKRWWPVELLVATEERKESWRTIALKLRDQEVARLVASVLEIDLIAEPELWQEKQEINAENLSGDTDQPNEAKNSEAAAIKLTELSSEAAQNTADQAEPDQLEAESDIGKNGDEAAEKSPPQQSETTDARLAEEQQPEAHLPTFDSDSSASIDEGLAAKATNENTLDDPDQELIDTSPQDQPIFTAYAGVVLAHPYLPALFTALGYWQEDAFANRATQQRAVYLLHYLATGEAQAREEATALAKLLCGWPVSGSPALLTEPLQERELVEADDLLRAVIEHWKAIGKATPQGLREGFFARDGKLTKTENGWRITVERKTQDLLLGQLPWGISLIKCPWHESIIKVSW